MFFTAATAELSNGPSPLDLAIDTEAIVPSGNMPICNVTDMLLRADGGRLQPSEALTRIRSSKLPAVSSPRSSAKACCRSGLSDSKSASACAFLKFLFIYTVLFLVVLAVLFIKHRLTRMPIGRAWEALREDEIACRSMGLNHVLVKLSAFTIGASTAGLAGVFFASYQGFVNPTSFTFFESALILAIVVLGGMGSTVGVVIAAFVLTVAPELLRSFSEYRVLLFGILMVLMMIWRPRGLIRISRTGVKPRKGALVTEGGAR